MLSQLGTDAQYAGQSLGALRGARSLRANSVEQAGWWECATTRTSAHRNSEAPGGHSPWPVNE